MMDTEEHWSELHQPQGLQLGEVLRSAGQRLKAMPLAEVAGFAAAGIVLGAIFFSRGKFIHTSRGRRFARTLEKSVIPAAKKGLHQAYDTLRDGKSFDRMGREIAKLRSRW